jgi:circadian clock protein KaiC
MDELLRPPLADDSVLASSGIPGLDDILAGGFTSGRLFLIEGVPGSGKTTLALQFLLEGVRRNEPVLYVTLSESEDEIKAVAESHGWRLDGVAIREVIPSERTLASDEQYTMFHPAEVELSETTRTILADVERTNPRRVVFDSMSELRLLAGSALRYRRQILALKQFFAGKSSTVLLLDDLTGTDRDLQVQSISHGVVSLEQTNPEYGADRRRLRVVKYRGRAFRGGNHDYVIRRGGLQVYPRLIAAEHRRDAEHVKLMSDVPALDELLGGGLERGTSTLIVGAAGTGKSTIAAQFAVAAADRRQHAALFLFDESVETLISRTTALGIDVRKHLDSQQITVQSVDPAELSPGELVHQIRIAVEERHASIIVIDSLNGYLNAMPGERYLIIQLHELLMYLGHRGVATILIGAHQGLIGSAMNTPVDASYLADAVILLRYFEAGGEVRQAISVVKKRGGQHERTIREFHMTRGGLEIGEPLREFRGVLSGVPIYEPDPAGRPATGKGRAR